MTKQEFLTKISNIIVAENNKRNRPLFPSVVIAQALCESAWRTKSNNDESKCGIWNKMW